jgi:hypothetical protein
MNFPPCATFTRYNDRTEISRFDEILLNCAKFQVLFARTASFCVEPVHGLPPAKACIQQYLILFSGPAQPTGLSTLYTLKDFHFTFSVNRVPRRLSTFRLSVPSYAFVQT